MPTAIERDGSIEGVEHRLVDVRAEVDAVEIAVEIDAGDAAGPEVDFVVGFVVEVDVGADFGLEESELVVGALMKIVLSKFVLVV